MLLINVNGNTSYTNPADEVADVFDIIIFLRDALSEPPEDGLTPPAWDGLNHILGICAELLFDAWEKMNEGGPKGGKKEDVMTIVLTDM